MNVRGGYLRRSRSRSSGRSSPRESFTCSRTPRIAARTFFRPAAASLARSGSRSGPKMKSAARARTRISPHPIESNTAAPALGLGEGDVDLLRLAAADQFDRDLVAGLVGVDRDGEFLRAADRLRPDGDHDVLLADPRRRCGAALLDVEHQGAVP